MAKKKLMRGLWWYIILLGSLALIVEEIVYFVKNGRLDDYTLFPAILGVLYILAFFLVPLFVKPSGAPAAESENRDLTVPAHLTIIRDSSMAGAAIPCIITLDGQTVCTLNNGCSAVVTLTKQQSILQTNSVGSSNVRLKVNASDGAQGEVHVKGGVFLPKTLHW